MARYMVDVRGSKPDLVRCVNGVFERYDPRAPGKWKRSESLDKFSYGGGDFVWFDDISEKEAASYMAKIDDYVKKKG